jgi:gluconokinase
MPMTTPEKIIVMGVSGCGKSSIGARLAEQLGLRFFDGDDFHPIENVTKMSQGRPLNDEDRAEWLATLNRLLNQEARAVVACSGLKPHYRSQLTDGNDATIVYLKGDIETIWSRHQAREGHFFAGKSMLESQFRDLVEPDTAEAIHIDIRQSKEAIVEAIIKALSA